MSKKTLLKLFEGSRASLFPIYLMDLAATHSVVKLLGKTVNVVINFYYGTDVKTYINESSWREVCDIAQKKLIKNNKFFNQIKEGMIRECEKLKNFSDCLLIVKPAELTNKELVNLYEEFEKITLQLRAFAWIPNMVDAGTVSIFELAEERIRKILGLDPKIQEYISKLTTPTEETQQRKSNVSLYKIQAFIQNKKIKNWINNQQVKHFIDEYVKEFCWLAYYYIGPAWKKKDIVELLRNNLKNVKNPDEKVREMTGYNRRIGREKKMLLNKLNLNTETKLLLEKITAMIFLKAYRKEFLIYSNYCFEPILIEIGNRLGFSLGEIRFLTRVEIKKYLLNKKSLTVKIRTSLKNRLKDGCVSITKGKITEIINLKEGEKYLAYVKEEEAGDSIQVKGNVAYVGIARGIARIINLKQDVNKMKIGEILVSRSTNPDLVSAMQKAAAFVTDEGGITSHAAIVAREMKKPCVIGTKRATKIISDGDLIEVDARQGVVKIIR